MWTLNFLYLYIFMVPKPGKWLQSAGAGFYLSGLSSWPRFVANPENTPQGY